MQATDESRDHAGNEALATTSEALTASASVLTHRNNAARSGAYLAETTLTPSNVNSSTFGKLYERAVKGDIFAQPLYARGVSTPSGTKNLVYIATSTNDLYAFDASNTSTDPYAGLVWHRNLDPWRPQVIGTEICSETMGSVGVTSTPVIDPNTGTMYVVTRRSGGRVVASGGSVYQLHNSGLIWKYTGTPCANGNCPGWQLFDDNPRTVQIAADLADPGLFQLHRTGQIWASTNTACSGSNCPGWTSIDNDPLSIHIEAAGISGGSRLVQLREDGSILEQLTGSSTWTLDDDNPATTQIAVATWTGGSRLYQMHRDGTIWMQTGSGVPGWTMLDDNPAGVMIAAAGSDLYQLHNTGRIWKYTGTPCSGASCPGWQMLDDNPATVKIVASPVNLNTNGGSSLYQLHDAGGNDAGSIWKYTGAPCNGTSCLGWERLDDNNGTADIVSDNVDDQIYQVHIDGSIWSGTGVACSGNFCPGWEQLDNNWALNDGANYLHAINIADGSEPMLPMKIEGTDPLHGSVTFDSRAQRNRPGLLLSNGTVYVGFATYSCDAGAPNGNPYHGWVFGYRTSDLAQVAAFDTSGDGGGAGIWQSGGGLVGAGDGSIYFETGNDTYPHARLGDSFVKLSPETAWPGLVEAGHFTPSNAGILRDGGTLSAAATAANGGNSHGAGDTDLGSGGPMLLPNGRLIGGGKQGRYYVLNTATMQLSQNATLDADGFEGFQAFVNTWHSSYTHQDYEMGEVWGPNIHSGPVFFNNRVYQMPEKDYLKGFAFDTVTSLVGTTAAATASGQWSRPPDGMPGGASSVSANGPYSGIVWTALPQANGQWVKVPGVLAAFDASTLTMLWADASQETYAKFTPPTIADGRVYRVTFDSNVHHGIMGKFIAYGLFSGVAPAESTEAKLLPRSAATATPGPATAARLGGSGSWSAPDPIADTYWRTGGPHGELGQSVGDEQAVGDAAGGRYQDYVSGPRPGASGKAARQQTLRSAVYWSPATGAHIVSGEILGLWRYLGAERSALGYPLSDETNTDDATGRVSRFQHGEIVLDGRTSPVVHMTP